MRENTAKSSIKRAMLELLAEKDYNSISVSELAERAGVARMSFYRNFNSTDDVLEDIANDLFYIFIPLSAPL